MKSTENSRAGGFYGWRNSNLRHQELKLQIRAASPMWMLPTPPLRGTTIISFVLEMLKTIGTCDTKSVKIALPDVAPPVFTQNVTSTKATDGLNKLRVWTLNFKVTDNNSRLERMRINVYRTYSTVAEIPADIDGNLDPQAQDETNITLDTGNDEVTINNLIGKSQNSGYVNYLVVVADEYGNKTSQNVSYIYDTKLL